ncbi:MAG TPA: dienelactone hydrolase family protein [Ilumatobacter sp.]|nr:dienelactone hydrolase family protein [Ilumatobacter sp.]
MSDTGGQRRTTKAPDGNLATYTSSEFSAGRTTHRVWRKGSGPAVIVITEMPGISPTVLGFADRVVALGCTAVLPDLFGTAGARVDSQFKAMLAIARTCIRREFTVLAAGASSPVIDWLRELGAHEHRVCGGPGIGVVGMCFTGGFALALATDAHVLAPVLSQPSLPFPVGARRRRSIDTNPADIATVAGRCATDGLQVIGLRFKGDKFVPGERFDYLREQLGDGFLAVELAQDDGNPDGPMGWRHSVLTGDLADEPGEPTRQALDDVLALFASKLLGSTAGGAGDCVDGQHREE